LWGTITRTEHYSREKHVANFAKVSVYANGVISSE
jgi:hypothetical protein